MSFLNVKSLSIAFGDSKVVENVSFSVSPGEILAIVGESGSGKSLTAAALGALTPAGAQLEGEIDFDQTEVLSASDAAKRALRGNEISYIFQEPMTALNPLHKIGKQIAEGLILHQDLKGDALEREVISLMHEVGLKDHKRFIDALPHELSGGQRQRICIAMALANKPKLLVADEPTTALDATVEKQILDLLKDKQAQQGFSMIFITHDLRLLRNFADRVMVMQKGKVIEIGAVEQVLSNPNDPYSQALIAAGHYEPRPMMRKRPKPRLIAKNLCVTYGKPAGFLRKSTEFRALKPVDIDLGAGEAIGLVGESGSGKSTLGLALMRLIKTQGTVTLDGEVLSADDRVSIRKARRNVQMVFQDPYGSLSPRMSVAQIIGEGLRVHEPRANIDQAVREIMPEVELDPEHMARYPHEFSGGQRQRIAIARALILRPKLLILDEPTSALDRTVQKQIVALLLTLQERYEMGYVFISHDLSVVRAICHRVIVLKDGDIVEQGPTQKIYEDPSQAYTQSLIDAAKE